MFIIDLHDKMVNIGDFESITIKRKSFIGNEAHCIVGIRSYHENKPLRGRETVLGMFLYRKHAEKAYEDLMNATAESKEIFRIPDDAKLIEESDAETLNALQEYEQQWQKDNTQTGCVLVLGILFSLAAITCSLL